MPCAVEQLADLLDAERGVCFLGSIIRINSPKIKDLNIKMFYAHKCTKVGDVFLKDNSKSSFLKNHNRNPDTILKD